MDGRIYSTCDADHKSSCRCRLLIANHPRLYETGCAMHSTSISRTTLQSPLAVITRLHRGVGLGLSWILLTDSFALAMVVLGISGLLLWSRGRTKRQMVFIVVSAAIVLLVVVGGHAVI